VINKTWGIIMGMKLLKYIAPQKLLVNGRPSPCECTDTVTCAYCVQANLLGMERKFQSDQKTTENIITTIKRKGIRQTARDLNVDHSSVRHWLNRKNIPQWVIEKYAGVGNQ
jgi:hypothetical protein